ncbi:MAG: hypothetical protein IJP74_13210 [Prevotella sp.]|nr:hypothetical protein [Prevotella sp.]
MKIKAILLSLLCIVGITTATAQSDVWVWKGGSPVKTEMADSITFTAPALTGPRALAEATTEDIGKIIGEDGKIYATKEAAEDAGITAVAMIAYVGNDAETNSTYRHGLALALKDVSGTQLWCSQYAEACLSNQHSSKPAAMGDMAGLANTDALVYHSSHTHAAATAARNYKYADGVAEGVHPLVTSAWFLPSAGQWYKMATAAGGSATLKTNAGLQWDRYWSSSEVNAQVAWYFGAGGYWGRIYKDYDYPVRPCLAF